MPVNAASSSDKHQTILDQFHYQVRRFLGYGGGGFVYLAADMRKKKKRVAVKVVQQNNPLGEGEWRHWLRLRHANLVQLFEKFEVGGDRYYIMEFAANGTLFDWLKKNKAKSGLPAISEQRSRKWVKQLLEAIRYLHAQGLYHFDIKSSNILLDASLNVKLSDFGTMKSLQDENFRHNGCRFYRPPEVLSEQTKLRSARSLEAVDVWALGATLLRVFSGGKLISYREFNQCNSENKSELVKNIRENLDRVITVPLAVEGVRDLMLQMLNPDPRKRPSCLAALRHPWLSPMSPMSSPKGNVQLRRRSQSTGITLRIEEKEKESRHRRKYSPAVKVRSPDLNNMKPLTPRPGTSRTIREHQSPQHRRPKTAATNRYTPPIMEMSPLRCILKPGAATLERMDREPLLQKSIHSKSSCALAILNDEDPDFRLRKPSISNTVYFRDEMFDETEMKRHSSRALSSKASATLLSPNLKEPMHHKQKHSPSVTLIHSRRSPNPFNSPSRPRFKTSRFMTPLRNASAKGGIASPSRGRRGGRSKSSSKILHETLVIKDEDVALEEGSSSSLEFRKGRSRTSVTAAKIASRIESVSMKGSPDMKHSSRQLISYTTTNHDV